MRKLSMAVAVSSIALVAPGMAAADSFNYAAIKGGWTQVTSNHFDTTDWPDNRDDFDARTDVRYDDGFNGSLAFGRQYDSGRDFNVRIELELGYQEADVNQHRVRVTDRRDENVPETDRIERPEDSDGEFSMAYGFISAYGERDLDLIPNTSFIFGAGGGAIQVVFDDFLADGAIRMDDDDVTFGFHLTTGWAYHVTDRIALEATYRYISAEDVGMEAEDGTSTRQRVESHNLMAGLRVGF